jgi:homeobox-leucine zipper protein
VVPEPPRALEDFDRLRAAHDALLADRDALLADNDRLRSQVKIILDILEFVKIR